MKVSEIIAMYQEVLNLHGDIEGNVQDIVKNEARPITENDLIVHTDKDGQKKASLIS